MYSLWTYQCPCVPFIFVESEKCWFGESTWLPLHNGNHWSMLFIIVTLITEVLFCQFSRFILLCNWFKIADKETQWILHLFGVHSTITSLWRGIRWFTSQYYHLQKVHKLVYEFLTRIRKIVYLSQKHLCCKKRRGQKSASYWVT